MNVTYTIRRFLCFMENKIDVIHRIKTLMLYKLTYGLIHDFDNNSFRGENRTLYISP